MGEQFTDDDYINYDPFDGDESDLQCRTVSIRKAKKEHTCYGLNGKQDHKISAGERYRYERALVDGDFWGEFKMCLNCMDKYIAGDEQVAALFIDPDKEKAANTILEKNGLK